MAKTNKKENTNTKTRTVETQKQTKFIIGTLFVLFSIALLFAFTSYYLHGNSDQSQINFFNDRNVPVKNWLGKFGFLLSYIFIYKGFGIASFLFVKLFFITGIYRILELPIIRLKKMWFWDLFAIITIAITLGFLGQTNPELGGIIGFEMNLFFQDYIGKIGTILLLILALVSYLIFRLQISPQNIKSFFEKTQKNIDESLTNEHTVSKTQNTIQPNPIEKSSTHIEASKTGNSITNENNVFEKQRTTLNSTIENLGVSSFSNTINSTDLIVEVPKEEERFQEPSIDNEFVIQKVTEETTLDENLASRLVKDFGEFDPTLELSNYKFPSIDLLKEYAHGGITINQEELEENKNKIIETLRNYKIDIAQIKATIGPSVTLYEIVPEAGIRISKIKSLEDDIALSLSALGIRIIAPIPGKGTIGIEVPNKNPTMVAMRSAIGSTKFQESEMELPIALGKTISNETFVVDLAKMPHLLMAGATGQGKSVGLNAVLTSLLYKKHPAEVKFVLVDPKKVELTLFNKIERHYLAKLPDSEDAIITDNTKVINTLNSLCIEMDNRYNLLKDAMVRNIKEYNEKFKQRKLNPEHGHRFLPYIVLVVDEFADLIMTAGKEVEIPIARLAQLARAIGIHLIIATQRPSVNVITGIIKANFPARIAFRVTSKIDSRTILDTQGADQLIGRGDLLYTNGNDITRVQCAFVDTPEVEKITEFIGAQKAYPDAYLLPEYSGEETGTSLDIDISERDSLFREAAEVIVSAQQGSASLLQRKLKLGYNRAGRLIDQLESAGIVGPFEGSKARNVLIQDMISLEHFFNTEKS